MLKELAASTLCGRYLRLYGNVLIQQPLRDGKLSMLVANTDSKVEA